MADRHVYEMATTRTLVSPDILIYDPGYIRDDCRGRIRALFRVFNEYRDRISFSIRKENETDVVRTDQSPSGIPVARPCLMPDNGIGCL